MSAPETPAPRTVGDRVRRFFVRLALLAIAVLAGWLLFVQYMAYSEGSRSGVVTKLSKRGVLLKTWEGQLSMEVLGTAGPEGGMRSELFDFSVPKGDDDLYRKLEEASLSGERVNLYFTERYARLPWRGETVFFATGVERGGAPPGPTGAPPVP